MTQHKKIAALSAKPGKTVGDLDALAACVPGLLAEIACGEDKVARLRRLVKYRDAQIRGLQKARRGKNA